MEPRASTAVARNALGSKFMRSNRVAGLIMLIADEFPAAGFIPAELCTRTREKHRPGAVIRAKSNCGGERLRERETGILLGDGVICGPIN